jgi:hypothetical protein
MFSPNGTPPTSTLQTTSPAPGPDEGKGGRTLPSNTPETEDLPTWQGPRAATMSGNNACDKLLLMEMENSKQMLGLDYLTDVCDSDWDKLAEAANYSFDDSDGGNFHSIEQAIYSTLQKNEETLESFNARLDAWFSKLQARNLQEGIRLLDARSLLRHETQYRYMASEGVPNSAGTNDEGACYTVDFYLMEEGEMRELLLAEQEMDTAFRADVGKQLFKVARDRFLGKRGVRGSRGKGHSNTGLAERKGASTRRRCSQTGHMEAECPNKAKPNPTAATGANAPAAPGPTPQGGGGPSSSSRSGPGTTWENGPRSAYVPYSD